MDMNILKMIQRIHNRLLDSIMVFITSLGDNGFIWIMISVILISLKKYRKCGVRVIIALLLSVFFVNVIMKNLFSRSRPCWVDKSINLKVKNPKDYSFPSGHTSASFAAAIVIFFNYRTGGIIALILASLIGFSRMYLFVHYPSDVLVGGILGWICGVLSYTILQ